MLPSISNRKMCLCMRQTGAQHITYLDNVNFSNFIFRFIASKCIQSSNQRAMHTESV